MYTKRNLVSAILAVAIMLLTAIPATPATPEQIEAAIDNGIAWLLANQNADGSWGNYAYVGVTGLAVVKLQDRARELNTSDYDDEIQDGLDYIFSQATIEPYGSGSGICFAAGWNETYNTGIAMMAIANDGDLNQTVDGGPLNDKTYQEVLQGNVDFFTFTQNPDGGWRYQAGMQNSDQSNTGYAVLGLGYAEDAGVVIPALVKTNLNNWINAIQGGDGGSQYTIGGGWENELKTGNLMFQMTFVGDDPGSARFLNALAYIESHWRDANQDPGWGYNNIPHYQAMYCLMKGLQYSDIDLIDTDGDGQSDDDWFNQDPPASPAQDFASAIVAAQLGDGSWPSDYWGDNYLATAWALLTLQKVTIEHVIEVEIDIKPGSFPNSINLGSKGVLPVAILTTEDFDATTVVPETVGFGPSDALPVQWALEDVDDDGDVDMIFHFKTQDTGISAGDTEATLTGGTLEGKDIEGTDSVRTVPPK